MSELKLLAHMVENPGWHFGLDMVKAKCASRFFIYLELAKLEDLGWIERQDEPNHQYPGLPRHQFRSALVSVHAQSPLGTKLINATVTISKLVRTMAQIQLLANRRGCDDEIFELTDEALSAVPMTGSAQQGQKS